MSYSRWINSCWYSFYNVNEKLSLWFSLDTCNDFEYEACKTLTAEKIKEIYDCTAEEATEAMEYVDCFLNDYNEKLIGKDNYDSTK